MKAYMKILKRLFLFFLMTIGFVSTLNAARQMEYLDRGLVAVKVNNGVFVSWRFLGTDHSDVAFDLYRDGVKVNESPISTKTNYLDPMGQSASSYVVKCVRGGVVLDASSAVTPWQSQCKTLTLRRPGSIYSPNDMSVGDVDGDGQYELFVKWDPNNSQDNSKSGVTDKVYIDCYRLDGTFLWRIDLGINIRAGAHYTQYQVYDYDGDGKCELVCKTAPGTKDGKGKSVIMGSDNPNADYRNSDGYILSGPEYLTIFKGATGEEINTVAYKPARGTVSSWGDKYGNRVDRFLACTAFLDGEHPSVVMCRGYYTRSTLTAYDFKNGKLVERWFHDSPTSGKGAYGEGFHNLSVADVDGDGFDEIIYGSALIDHDGRLMYRTGLGHGDAMHVSDLNPDNPGLEGWFVHEEKELPYGYELRDLKSGKILFGMDMDKDNGRGLAADIDARHRGFEMWSSAPGVFDCKGNKISDNKPSVNFRIYWDGDLQDELLDGNTCTKWNGNGVSQLIQFQGNSCNGTKATPCLSADILGDWREEVILQDGDKIYLYTTTIESKYRLFTPMHDPVYRCGVAWQNTSYNQPPHLGFYIGDGLDGVEQPDIYTPGHPTEPFVPTKALLSFEGNLHQELMPGESFSPITFTFGGAATDVVFFNLPASLQVQRGENSVTLSGEVLSPVAIQVKTVGGENEIVQTVTIDKVDPSLKRVAYVTDPDGANYAMDRDRIIKMLREDGRFYVREIAASSFGNDYSLFDMVVISETTPSTSPVMAELKGLPKPMLSMKVHGYKSANGAWDWAATGYGDNTTATAVVVEPSQLNHPIFKDVVFSDGNEVEMFHAVDTKALTYMNPQSFKDASGDIVPLASIKGDGSISILEVAKGSVIAGTLLSENYIQIGVNSSSYGQLTEDGLSVIRNACCYLMGMDGDVTSLGEAARKVMDVVAVDNPVENELSLRFRTEEGGHISLEILSMSGVRVAQFETMVAKGDNHIVLPVEWPSDNYLLLIRRGEEIWSLRFISK